MRVARILIAVSLLLTWATASVSATTAIRIKEASDLAADYLLRSQTKKGLFSYDVNFKTGKPTGQSSIVRQAGAGFALSEYLAATQSPRARKPVRRALHALQKRSRIFRKPSQWLVGGDGGIARARTGSTALALLVELNYYRTTGDGRFEAARNGWLKGLLALRLGKRGFRKTPYTKKESSYFNGEVWLALAKYYDTFRDAKVGSILDDLDVYLINKYTLKPNIGFFHWGVMAAAIRYQNTRDFRLLTFINDQTRIYLEELRPEVKVTHNTCYALEGLITASQILSDTWNDSAIFPKLSRQIESEVTRNLTFQLIDENEIEILRQRWQGKFNPSQYVGLYFSRSNRNYSRIDHTQHCLSAFLKLRSE